MFKTVAASLAEGIKAEFADIENLELVVTSQFGGFNGFEVYVEDQLIFSNLEEGRFPSTNEIVDSINEYLKEGDLTPKTDPAL